jgi:hypothetical protein
VNWKNHNFNDKSTYSGNQCNQLEIEGKMNKETNPSMAKEEGIGEDDQKRDIWRPTGRLLSVLGKFLYGD